MYPIIKFSNDVSFLNLTVPEKPIIEKNLFGLYISGEAQNKYEIQLANYKKEIKKKELLYVFSKTKLCNRFLIFNHRRLPINGIPGILADKKKNISKAQELFYPVLKRYFGEKIRNDVAFGYYSSNGNPYKTHFVYSDTKKHLNINIQIDHPYDILRYPLGNNVIERNFKGSNDKRDSFFLDHGWIILRFTEEQIIKNPFSCCKYIAELIYKLTFEFDYLVKLIEFPDLKESNEWTENMAKEMANSNFRENYLKPNLFTDFNNLKSYKTNLLKYEFLLNKTYDYIESIKEFDKFGNIVEEVFFIEGNNLPIKFIFNNYNKTNELSESATFIYNKNNLTPELFCFNVFEYIEGKQEKSTFYDLSKLEIITMNYVYSKDGLVNINKTINGSSKLIKSNLVKNGLIYISEIFENSNGFYNKEIYYYDNSLNLIQTKLFDSKGNLIGTFNYEYNEDGRKIREKLLSSDFSQEKRFIYTETGKLQEEIISGKEDYKISYKYNREGHIIEKETNTGSRKEIILYLQFYFIEEEFE